ncbi:GNAT family N-acetyltransferase [Arthrobacter sp. AET 35A]|uniref:GNAT family N-acetyltransferase n=1 Tax=Arthrobacter sp. AET 35A TaxID=2292643 RepID=UPI00177C9A97|nr:GNAT family N-acetyltransferase [Arthrobacter sp. AET 35A]MBE0011312.1 GNAT family N-acetyltransferase [Arthrobacter sp. AET 35A]
MNPVNLLIDRPTADDADRLADLAAITFPLACPASSRPEDIAHHIATELSAAKFREHLADPTKTLLSLHDGDGDRLAGFSMLIHGDPTDAGVRSALSIFPTIEVSKFYVHPDHHGQGQASALMQATLEAAAQTGVRAAWLGTNNENLRAIRFYEKHGFTKVGVKTFRLGAGVENDFIFELALPER